MVFSHDTEAALRTAVQLANSMVGPDTLESVADLNILLARSGPAGHHDGNQAELKAVRAVRAPIYALLTANCDDAVTTVNQMLADAEALPQLVQHDEFDWHVHAVSPDAPLAQRLIVETALAMVDVIRSGGDSRIDLCADDRCERIVLDLSRNRCRRFCSTTCGNRNAVAAFRARRAARTG